MLLKSSLANAAAVKFLTPKGSDPLGCIKEASLELRGRVRALISLNAQRKDWQSPEVDEEGKEVFSWLNQSSSLESIYAANPDDGRILLARRIGLQVIFQLDVLPIISLQDCFCIEITELGFLLLHKTDKVGIFTRIGCSIVNRDKTFFGNAGMQTVTII